MIKSIIEYWNEVMVPAFKWVKRHWKGFTVFTVACYAVSCAWLWYSIKRNQKELKELCRELEEES